MNIYKRFFRVTSGLLMDEADRLLSQRNAAKVEISALGKEIGADVLVYDSGGIAGFKFGDLPNQDTWRKPDREGLCLPRKNTASGKALWEKIDALPDYPDSQKAMESSGLNRFCLHDPSAGRVYSPTFWGSPEKSVLFVSVPWADIDPEELERYRQDRAAGNTFSSDLEHLLWTPPPEWEEVKEWQVLKEGEEMAQAEQDKQAGAQ